MPAFRFSNLSLPKNKRTQLALIGLVIPSLIALIVLFTRYRDFEYEKWLPTYPYSVSRNPLMKPDIGEPKGKLTRPPSPESAQTYKLANATLLSLVRNQELEELLPSIEQVEATFNSKFHYPWTFINDVPFTAEFKKRTKALLPHSQVNYEVIPEEHWQEPEWFNADLYNASAQYLKDEEVQFADMLSYHRMCRWNSGMFYKHPKLLEYRWYWRVEPKTNYFCQIDYDVFKFMEDNDKTYGFVINIYDSPASIETLWPVTLDFLSKNPQYVHKNAAVNWLRDSKNRPGHNLKANGYSTCHFWSNFEIGDMDFWRSEAYEAYFEHLDKNGGFYYERWGDAPVHSVALGLFLDSDKIHWFKDIGYQHIPFFNCPNSPKCSGCIKGLFSDGTGLSQENCMHNWLKYTHPEEL